MRAALALLWLAVSFSVWGASSQVQYVTTAAASEAFASSTSNALSLPGAATVGSQIQVSIACRSNTAPRTISSISDNGSTVYASRGTRSTNGNASVDIWSGPATSTSAGANVVVTASGTLATQECRILVAEIAGVETDQSGATSNNQTTAATTTHSSGSVTPANSSDFISAAAGRSGGDYTEDPDFTENTPTGGGAWPAEGFYFGYLANPSGVTANEYTSSANETTANMIVAFEGISAGGTVVNPITGIGGGAARPVR